MNLEVKPFGDRGAMVILDDAHLTESVRVFLTKAFSSKEYLIRNGISSVLVEAGAPSLLVYKDTLETMASFQLGAILTGSDSVSKKVISIPCVYDGEDIAYLRDFLGASREAIISKHTGMLWRVALIGFAPGFPYLLPLDEQETFFANLERRLSPRPSVPAGSVCLAGGMSAIYPNSMPGGWHLIGRSNVVLFNPMITDPSLLHPGDIVQFTIAETL